MLRSDGGGTPQRPGRVIGEINAAKDRAEPQHVATGRRVKTAATVYNE